MSKLFHYTPAPSTGEKSKWALFPEFTLTNTQNPLDAVREENRISSMPICLQHFYEVLK